MIVCTTCESNLEVAAKASANGRVYLAGGVRADSGKKLRGAVDHLRSAAHTAAVEADKLQRQWDNKTSQHPWVAVLAKTDAGVTQFLTELAVTVYNDSLLETPTAWSWPARSLAAPHQQRVWSAICEGGWDAELGRTAPPPEALRYRSPDAYREMLAIIAELERRKLRDKIAAGVVYSLQIDGSMDRQQLDNKFVTVRVFSGDGQLATYLAGVVEPEEDGAPGLLEAIISIAKQLDLPLENLVGVTTDGESANTGRRAGLWKRLNDHLGRDIIAIWCVCHRSDLAVESLKKTVTEVQRWMSDLHALTSFFRTAKTRTKRLRESGGVVAFPAMLDVRFAEHLLSAISATLSNLAACREVWQAMAASGSRLDRAEARGLLKKWACGGQTERLTALMADVASIFCRLQKKFQRGDLVLPEVLETRDGAIRQLQLMQTGPLPGVCFIFREI